LAPGGPIGSLQAPALDASRRIGGFHPRGSSYRLSSAREWFPATQAYVGEFWEDALIEFKRAAAGDATSALPDNRAVAANRAETTVVGAE